MRTNEEQTRVLEAIRSFLRDDSLDVFILRGSAGTGKTTLIARLTAELDQMHLSYALLAPTGRAARILANKIRQINGQNGASATTIHSAIYASSWIELNEAAESANDPGIRFIYPLREDETSHSLLVVDESSMVGDKQTHGDYMQFGSGRLLKDLVTFARIRRSGRMNDNRTKLLFVGDAAQLPPVGEVDSVALSDAYLEREYDLKVGSADLRTVMRQSHDSAILNRATALRDALFAGRFNQFSLKPDGNEIEVLDVRGALDRIVRGIEAKESNVAIVYSNNKALEYNRSVRERRWGDANLPVQTGDMLLVHRNSNCGLRNGDLVKVTRAAAERHVKTVSLKGEHRVELLFRQVSIAYRDGDGKVIEYEKLILENLLDSPNRELTPLEQRALYVEFRQRHPDLLVRSDEFRLALQGDAWFNALQVKFGYALTCHKAQGGEGQTAIVDFGASQVSRNARFFRWAYTAITRAASRLIVISPPSFTPYDGIVATSVPGTSSSAVTEGSSQKADPTTDPDWLRLSFGASTAALMPHHQIVRALLNAADIQIEQLLHLQYCERYTVSRAGKRAAVQYFYDGKFRVGRVGIAPGALLDQELAQAAIESFNALTVASAEAPHVPFIQEFVDKLDQALADSSVKRAAIRSMPHRLRVTFTDSYRWGDVDFTYNGSSAWTAAQEVGGPGSTQGLYDEVHRLMLASGFGAA